MGKTVPAIFTTQSNYVAFKPIILVNIDSINEYHATRPVTVYMVLGANLATTLGSPIVTAVGANFQTNHVETADDFVITTGADAGTYGINSIDSETQITLDSDMTATAVVAYNIPKTYSDGFAAGRAISDISITAKRLGGYASIGDTKISFANQALFSDVLVTYTTPENDVVEIWAVVEAASFVLYSNAILLYKGMVDDFKFDKSVFSFPLSDSSLKDHKVIGTLVDEATYPNAPVESIGAVIPEIYGDHTTNLGTTVPADYTASRSNNFVKCIHVGTSPADPDKQRYLVANHQLDSMGVNDFWAYDSGSGRFVQVNVVTSIQNNANGAIIDIANDVDFHDYIFPDKTTSVSSGDWTNEANSCDHDADTYASSVHLDGDGMNTHDYSIDFTYSLHAGVTISSVRVFARTSYTETGGDFTYEINQDDRTGDTNVAFTDAGVPVAGGNTEAGANENIYVEHTKNDAQVENSTATVYEIYKKVTYSLDDGLDGSRQIDIYFADRGREYGTWIDGRAVAEGYSVDHPDDDTSGDLIENPAGMIESVYRDLLGFADADVDMDAFNIAADELSANVDVDWKLSFAITEPTDSKTLLDKLAKESKSWLFNDFQDKISIVAFKSAPDFTQAGAGAPDDADIFTDDHNDDLTTSGSGDTTSYDQNPMVKDSFEIWKTSPDEIGNDIDTLFYYNPITGQPQDSATDTDANSQTAFGTIEKTFKAEHIKDSTTAGKLGDYLIDRRKDRLWVCIFRTWLNAAWVEIGDVINVRHRLLDGDGTDGIFTTVNMNAQRWQVLGWRYIHNVMQIEITAIEI